MDAEQLKTEVMNFLPQGVALVLGLELHDPVLASLATLTLFTEGANKLREMNKSWLEEYATNDDVIKELDYFIKTPEFIQFLREVLIKVSYETRHEKRKALLYAAWNYVLKDKKFTFDEKMALLNLLDNLSTLEVVYLIHLYSSEQIPPEVILKVKDLNVQYKLASLGLIDADYSPIQNALEKLHKDIEEDSKYVMECIQKNADQYPRTASGYRHRSGIKNYNPFFDQANIKFEKNAFGKKFVELICLEDF